MAGSSPTGRALSAAIVSVADAEIKRLSKDIDGHGVAKCVQRGLLELAKIPKGGIPDYDDPWVVLLYLWYWPGHFNMCLALLEEAMSGLKPESKVHLVDFGSGPLTAQFAAHVAALRVSKRIEMAVDSFDTSSAMIEFGKAIWNNYRKSPSSIWKQQRTSNKFNELKKRIAEHPPWDSDQNEEHWLSAFHVFYEKAADTVRSDLDALHQIFDTTCYLASSHNYNSNLVGHMSPVLNSKAQPIEEPSRKVFDDTTQLTVWRRDLWESIGKHQKCCALHPKVEPYLYGQVPDWPRYPIALIWNAEGRP